MKPKKRKPQPKALDKIEKRSLLKQFARHKRAVKKLKRAKKQGTPEWSEQIHAGQAAVDKIRANNVKSFMDLEFFTKAMEGK